MTTVSASGEPPVVAVVGKGGAGKTVLACLLARALCDVGRTPLLLVDADPVGGLAWALDETPERDLARVGEHMVARAAEPSADPDSLAGEVDWQVLEAVVEREAYSLLSLGRPEAEGCFCPVHRLLREALGQLATGYALTVVDAEAGVEQLKRRAFDRISHALVVTDGSLRSATAAEQIAAALPAGTRAGLVLSRTRPEEARLPAGLDLLASLPMDETVVRSDRSGVSLWALPADNPALKAATRLLDWI